MEKYLYFYIGTLALAFFGLICSCVEKQTCETKSVDVEIKAPKGVIATPFKTIEEARDCEWFNDLVNQIQSTDVKAEAGYTVLDQRLRDEAGDRYKSEADINVRLTRIEERVQSINSLLQTCCDSLHEHMKEHYEERKKESVSVEDVW